MTPVSLRQRHKAESGSRNISTITIIITTITVITALSHGPTITIITIITIIIITIITAASEFIFARKRHKSLERDRVGAILPQSDWASLWLATRDRVEARHPASFDNPTDAV
jgi:hypothetical protein